MADAGEISEEVLVRRVQTGDEDALRLLFERYQDRIRKRVRRRLPARLDRKVSVADVLQETRLVAFRRAPEFEDRGDGSFGRWLHGIAELKVMEVIRRYARPTRARQREISRGGRVDTENFRAPEPSPSEAAAGVEESTRVRTTLATLSPVDQWVLRLTFEEKLSLREAAQRMGRSREAVKKLYARALRRFREALERGRGGGHAG